MQKALRHELEKKRDYGDRIRTVEFASFIPFFSTFGGLDREATVFYGCLADFLGCYVECDALCHFCYCVLLSWPFVGADLHSQGILPPL